MVTMNRTTQCRTVPNRWIDDILKVAGMDGGDSRAVFEAFYVGGLYPAVYVRPRADDDLLYEFI